MSLGQLYTMSIGFGFKMKSKMVLLEPI